MGDEKELGGTGPEEATEGPAEADIGMGEAGAAREEPAQDPARSEGQSARKHAKKNLEAALEKSAEEIAALAAQNEALKAEVKDLKDKWLRSAAEYENYRKRTRREWELHEQRTKAEIILDILAVVDDFERAFAVAGERDDDFVRGIRLIYNNLLSSLEKIGVRKIEALDAAFDPAYHMAVAQIERDGADSNRVVEIVQEGYCLGDFLVRPAKVVIAK